MLDIPQGKGFVNWLPVSCENWLGMMECDLP